MIRLILVLSISFQSLFCCCQDYYFKPDSSAVLDKSFGKELLKQCTRPVPRNRLRLFTIDSGTLKLLENNFLKIFLLPPAVMHHNTGASFLNRFAYQYMGVIIKQKKYIYVSAFTVFNKWDWTDRYKDWRRDPVNWCDGADDYFGVLFSIKHKTFTQFHFNGM